MNADLYIEHLSFLSQLEAFNGTWFLFAEHPGAKIEAISSVAVTYTVINARLIFFFLSLSRQLQLKLKNAMIHLVNQMSTYEGALIVDFQEPYVPPHFCF